MLVSILGRIRSGKTLFLVYIATKLIRDVYSNFKLDLPNYKQLTLSVLKKLPNNVNVYIDEGYTWLESRISGSKLNKLISYLLFQSGKRGLDIYITAQLFSSVDLRFREQSSLIVYCEKINGNFYYNINNREKNTWKTLVLTKENAKKYYPLYDTFEIIKPAKIDDLELEYVKDDPVALLLMVKNISNKIKNGLNVITHDSVEFALLANGYPLSLKKYVYLYLKSLVNV